MIKDFQTMDSAFNQNSEASEEFINHILYSTSVRDLVPAKGAGCIEGLSGFEELFLEQKKRFTPVANNNLTNLNQT